eukprot:gene45881-58748_t
MKRLFILFLICLLPMQVFAGMITFKGAIAQQTQPGAMPDVNVGLSVANIDGSDSGNKGDNADTSAASNDGEDFSSHAAIGDEPVLYSAQLFVVNSATLAPALRSDAACRRNDGADAAAV